MKFAFSESRTVNVPANDGRLKLADENRRIRDVFAQRKEKGGPLDLYGMCLLHELQEALVIFFRKIGLSSLKDQKILDVGCGSGGMLWRLQEFGADPRHSFGIDLIREKLSSAHRVSSGTGFVEGNAVQLPFRDQVFDMAFQFLVFTSVLDQEMKRTIAAEIVRTLRPGGYFIWYDFRYSNPRNPNVRGVGRREIEKLLPGCRLQFQWLTLAPPIGRAAVEVSPVLYRVLSTFPILRTHYLCFAQKM